MLLPRPVCQSTGGMCTPSAHLPRAGRFYREALPADRTRRALAEGRCLQAPPQVGSQTREAASVVAKAHGHAVPVDCGMVLAATPCRSASSEHLLAMAPRRRCVRAQYECLHCRFVPMRTIEMHRASRARSRRAGWTCAASPYTRRRSGGRSADCNRPWLCGRVRCPQLRRKKYRTRASSEESARPGQKVTRRRKGKKEKFFPAL